MAELCFLTYLNRSGSTLLAKKLDSLEGVSVSIEADLRDGLDERAGLILENEWELDEYLDELWRGEKFSTWGVSRGALREELLASPFPITFREVLPAMLRIYGGGEGAKVYVYKNDSYFRNYRALRTLFPGSKFIFVGRDPRGTYNSQGRTMSSSGLPMRRSPVTFAAHYRRTMFFLDRYLEGEKFFLSVKYEELVLDEKSVMSGLADFLEVSGRAGEGKGSYFGKIPDRQKSLHPNLQDDRMKRERISAWEHSLERSEIYFLQKALGDLLARKGYRMAEVGNLGLAERLRFFSDYLFFLLRFRSVEGLKKVLGRLSPALLERLLSR